MAKKKTRRKKSNPGLALARAFGAKRARSTKRKRRGASLGTLGRINSGTPKNHKPLRVLEKRLSRLTKIVAARKKNPSKWK